MPRKSAADTEVVRLATNPRSPITPPKFLRADERALFAALAAQNEHLKPTDASILALYSQAVMRTSKLARGDGISDWEKSARATLALARSLRLTAQSSTHPDTLSRQRRDQHRSVLAEKMRNYRAPDTDDDEH